VVQSQKFIRQVFAELYSGEGANDSRPDFRHPDSVIGEHIKEQELTIKLIADNNPVFEKEIRAWSWFDYNMHILSIKRKTDSLKDI
jgi:hypothetical protein